MEQQRPLAIGQSVIADAGRFGWNQASGNGLLPSNQLDGVRVERHAVETRSMLAGKALKMVECSLLFKDSGVALQSMECIEDACTSAG